MVIKYFRDSKMFEYDKFYQDCRQQNRPFIKAKINPLHGNYFVELDLITCNHTLSEKAQQQIGKLLQDEIEYVKSNLDYSFEDFHIGEEQAWFDGVYSEHVDAFCSSLYDLAEKNQD